MFNKKNSFDQDSKKAEKEAISSIIDTKMVMKGELLFEGKARIDGTIEGNIKGEHLILSEGGKITGDVQVSTFVCHGTLEGNIKSSILTARKTCQIHGRIESNNLNVEPGAKLDGEIKVAAQDLHLISDKSSSTAIKSQTANG
jgi:cytoskeletal protein CcmA (bactofilin family)